MLLIYNTLSHTVEEFKALNPPLPRLAGQVGIYSCGPTVYDYQHIGHMRTYVGTDILIRVLKENGFSVKHVMNITDVGHLVSDADTGEDKMEKGSKKFGKSVWDIAKMFEKQFKDSCAAVNISLPSDLMHATDYIKEQIELIKTLEEKGFTYKTSDGIYYDTSKFPDYFKLSRQNPEELKGGARVDLGDKKNITDFALWKFSYPRGVTREKFIKNRPASAKGYVEARQMEWESPWGLGFPGWHIECSAMSMKALGESFDPYGKLRVNGEHSRTIDIHTGGIDHVNIHHSNEIAQSEAVSGKQFVKYWIHFNHLLVNSEKMSKSLGNFYTVQDVIDKGFDPLALRYLYLQTHYRQEMNFTWESLKAAQTALERLRKEVAGYDEPKIGCAEYEKEFLDAVNDDLNIPKALSVLWKVVKSNYPSSSKAETIFKFDEVLGLSLKNSNKILRTQEKDMPDEFKKLLQEREALRKEKKYKEADEIRKKILGMGYKVEDKN